jgi:RNA polymerase sigma-70 factor (ECF subfamily)
MSNSYQVSNSDSQLVAQASAGDPDALGVLFDRYREKVKRMVALRMDRRLLQRVDASDVVQEAYVDCQNRFSEYLANQTIPFFAWVRFLAAR